MEAPDSLVIGVTGHLNLDAAARDTTAEAVTEQLRGDAGFMAASAVRIVAGLAPGADLLVISTISRLCSMLGKRCHLHVLMTTDVDNMLQAWRQRTAELNDPPSPAAQKQVSMQIAYWLQQAATVEHVHRRTDTTYSSHECLAARLALEPDLLVAIIRPSHPGQRGGAQSVLAWRNHPDRIPPSLSGVSSRLKSGARSLAIDPDDGSSTLIEHSAGS